jgi:hypothetical protein
MATCRVTLDGIFFDFTVQDVDSLMQAQDYVLAISTVMAAVAKIGIADPTTLAIVEAVIAGIAATVAIHKAEFLANNTKLDPKGNGVEVQLPNWAIVLGWFGALIMRPLPPGQLQQGLMGSLSGLYCLFHYRDSNQNGTGNVANGSIIGPGGWDAFKFLFSGGNGIIYAVDQQGNLNFYRDNNQDGTGQVANPSIIGFGGWNQFNFLFSGGNGIIYAVDQQGNLNFYRDNNQNGTGPVSNPSIIGYGGWNQFNFLFSGGNGALYAVLRMP